jgi:2-desacetyl-2-hydroxyethyl bacteriochlorophyllide A dehydrogenase
MPPREPVTSRRVVFPQQGRVEFEERTITPIDPGAGEVSVRTRYTLISTGTELTVLNGAYEPGSHWDHYAEFPFYPGYAAVGEVTAVGADVADLGVGDNVVLRGSHASEHNRPVLLCTPVPADVDLEVAPWFALAKIAFMGARAAQYALGDSVVVIGAGPIGQMSVRWANAAGARAVVAIDPASDRLELARRGGATAAIAEPVAAAKEIVTAELGGRDPDVVIDCTGNAEVFKAALGLVRGRGRVVLLGDTGAPSHQHLTSDLITRGVTVVGAHDGLSYTSSDWDGDRGIHSLFFQLVRTGRFDMSGLNTHTFPAAECAAAYDLAGSRRHETLGIVLDWAE